MSYDHIQIGTLMVFKHLGGAGGCMRRGGGSISLFIYMFMGVLV